jgi:selenide,water dikinase
LSWRQRWWGRPKGVGWPLPQRPCSKALVSEGTRSSPSQQLGMWFNHRFPAGPAAALLERCGAKACTDVTGFGLLGHLAEMVAASTAVCAELDLAAVPLLPGAAECLAAGALSSLHVENSSVASAVCNSTEAAAHKLWPLLVDPQTGGCWLPGPGKAIPAPADSLCFLPGGGLLIAVPGNRAAECVQALQVAGYAEAAVVGSVRACADCADSQRRITVALLPHNASQ